MKKEYLKPIARFHELRCRSMVAQSPIETKMRVDNSADFSETEWGD
jgi:hypothetical protein